MTSEEEVKKFRQDVINIGGYKALPNHLPDIMFNPGVQAKTPTAGWNEVIILSYLIDYEVKYISKNKSDWFYITNTKLSEITHLSESTCKRSIKNLITLNYIEKRKRIHGAYGVPVNHYRFNREQILHDLKEASE